MYIIDKKARSSAAAAVCIYVCVHVKGLLFNYATRSSRMGRGGAAADAMEKSF